MHSLTTRGPGNLPEDLPEDGPELWWRRRQRWCCCWTGRNPWPDADGMIKKKHFYLNFGGAETDYQVIWPGFLFFIFLIFYFLKFF